MGRIKDILKAPLTVDEKRAAANLMIRSYAKGFLEFVRNLVVVSFLFVLAEKSGKWYLYALALAAGFALWSTVYGYIDPLVLNQRPLNAARLQTATIRARWALTLIAFLVSLILLMLLTYGLSVSISFIVLEIVRVQKP
jgi:hypothetical protein